MYTVFVPVPTVVATALAPHRQKYDPLASVMPPHLSLLGVFEFDGNSAELMEHLDSVGESHAPIKVVLVSWDICKDRLIRLRLPAVAGREEMTSLYNHLVTGPLSFIAEQARPYEPAVIFGRLPLETNLQPVRQSLAGFEPNFTFRVHTFELWQRDQRPQPWRPVKEFGLKATVAGRLRRDSLEFNQR